MINRFLITTALEETWHTDQPVLFLGEWCRLYSRKERWSKMDAEVVPYHWNDRNKFYTDYQYLKEFYERALVCLAKQLNQIHGVNHSVRYWRILIGPWLAYFIQILFDRWSSIQQAVTNFDVSETIILAGNEEAFVPNDMVHFNQMIIGDEWNHQFYSFILKRFTKVSCIEKACCFSPVPTQVLGINFKHKIVEACAKVASHFVKDHDIFLINTYLPILSEVKLYLRFRQIPQWWKRTKPIFVPVDWRQREWLMTDKHSQTDFEKCVFAIIPKQIPRLFLEGYKQLIKQSENLLWPKCPNVIFTSSELWFGTVTMAYVAEKIELGIPLVYGQHGGLYNISKFTWQEEHEIAIADKFLTWGVGNRSNSKIKPVGMLTKMKRLSKKGLNSKGNVLLVLQSLSRYSARLDSEPRSGQLLKQINEIFLFVDFLLPACKNQVLVRPYLREFGWEHELRWREYGKVKMAPQKAKMSDLFKEAQLAIFTYNSTGYLEAFANDIPTIIFWNPEDCPLRDSAIFDFEELKRVGIFHETPMSAASHVNLIWNNVDKWWHSTKVRKTLESFKKRYCYLPEDLLDSVEHTLRDTVITPGKMIIQSDDNNKV